MESDWQHKFQDHKDRLFHLFDAKKFTDCHFVIVDSEQNQITISAHKIILLAASPVFERMFYGSMAEKDDPIVITDIQVEVFQSMLKYIYSGCIDIKSVDLALQLYYAAKKYLLKQLMEKCIVFLSANLNPQNVCQIFEFSEFFDEPSLKQKCSEFISDRTREVLADASFSDIKMSTMVFILDQDKLNINTELDLFNALRRLAIKKELLKDKDPPNTEQNSTQNSSEIDHSINCENEKWLKEAVRRIRFLTMTPQEFAEGPARSNLLDKQDIVHIFINLNSPNNVKCSLSEAICSSRICRTAICAYRGCNQKCYNGYRYCQYHYY
ncbi:BTB/POZ domain-containing protein 6-A-like [Lucilia sericata]|uniref:BTB/POZ domain-containing protein 6-A-like n=1 Tax=Lucilia sericata TaxID=13632 RepID=UPI0018A824D4|nr:BTB/POZ domain-containing protein 6-A-like [Lucilia sericata]XP_037824640.1 BTB/POZ domain-containing protein 6-A-like [Lucilia sericata]